MGFVGEIYCVPRKEESKLLSLLAKEDVRVEPDKDGWIKLVKTGCKIPDYIDWMDDSRIVIQVVGDPKSSKAYEIRVRAIQSIEEGINSTEEG